jgi:hypothetical protein
MAIALGDRKSHVPIAIAPRVVTCSTTPPLRGKGSHCGRGNWSAALDPTRRNLGRLRGIRRSGGQEDRRAHSCSRTSSGPTASPLGRRPGSATSRRSRSWSSTCRRTLAVGAGWLTRYRQRSRRGKPDTTGRSRRLSPSTTPCAAARDHRSTRVHPGNKSKRLSDTDCVRTSPDPGNRLILCKAWRMSRSLTASPLRLP